MPNVSSLKQRLKRYPAMYSVARTAHGWARLDIRWKRHRKEAFRRRCYSRFEAGERFLSRSYGEITVRYEAISPKNYWHLSMGSQHEDQFMGKLFKEYIQRGDVVLDIGAHTGMYSIPFARAVGDSGKVYAFEPEAQGYSAILRNAELNSLSNIEGMNMAVTDMDGMIDFFVRPDKDTHSIFEKTSAPSPLGIQERLSVRSSSVDSLLEQGLISQPDFVKIDVEGGELRVLDGMEKAAPGLRHILVEVHEVALTTAGIEAPKKAVEARLRNLGVTDLEYVDEIHILGTVSS